MWGSTCSFWKHIGKALDSDAQNEWRTPEAGNLYVVNRSTGCGWPGKGRGTWERVPDRVHICAHVQGSETLALWGNECSSLTGMY